MNAVAAINGALAPFQAKVMHDGQFRVRTHCLYPTGQAVDVYVEHGSDTFLIHDNGGALEQAEMSVASIRNALRQLQFIASSYGLRAAKNGRLSSQRVDEQRLSGAIMMVANASKDAATSIIDRWKPPRRNLRPEFEQLLAIEFPHRWMREQLVYGKSNKSYRFDYAIKLSKDRELLVDLVVQDANSINSAVVKHLDVKGKLEVNIEQRIIYDDQQSWASADLALLRVGATPVPYSHIEDVISRLAA